MQDRVTVQQMLRAAWRPGLMLLVITVTATAAGHLVPLRALHLYLIARPGVVHWLTLAALNLAAVGVLLLLAAHYGLQAGLKTQADRGAAQFLPVKRSSATPKPSGASVTRSASPVEPDVVREGPPVSLRELVRAWRRGPRHMTRTWRYRFLTVLGYVSLTLGVLGFSFLIGPPFIKQIVIGVAVAGALSIAWLVWQARE